MITDKKNILVCEFITAGGLIGQPLPDSLVCEGSLMRDQLCHELVQIGQYQLSSMYDARLPPPANVEKSLSVEERFEQAFERCLRDADLVWLIAPECDDVLLHLTQQCEAANVPVIGAPSSVVALTADKLETALLLKKTGLNTPQTFSMSAWVAEPQINQPWIVKPIKGVGCDGLLKLPDNQAVHAWFDSQAQATICQYCIQPEVTDAEPASLSLLCHDGKAYPLSCNRLVITQKNGKISLNAIEVNGFMQYWQSFQTLADEIANALPTMCGYLGVDVMLNTHTEELSVLEINPRLTSSYAGLAQATGQNIAQCLLDAYYAPNFVMPEILRQQVTIYLE